MGESKDEKPSDYAFLGPGGNVEAVFSGVSEGEAISAAKMLLGQAAIPYTPTREHPSKLKPTVPLEKFPERDLTQFTD